jgi:hypothetical protein
MMMRAVVITGVVFGALTTVCVVPARAVPVEIDLTISYQNPPALPAVQLTGTAEFWQDVNNVLINWGDSVAVGPLSVGDTFSMILYPPNPCNSTTCELGFSFNGMIGGTSIGAVGPNNEFPIIPIGSYYPPNPCTGTTCQSSGLLVGGDPETVGRWSVAVTQTPLPAALPLFATGLGAMCLLGWRRKRKASAIAA